MERTTSDNHRQKTLHRFLDEAGDTTFYRSGHTPAIGEKGVSLSFSLGMVDIRSDLNTVRSDIKALQKEVGEDAYIKIIPSVKKKLDHGGFYFHATDDPPEVRMVMFKYIKGLDCSFEMVAARKIPDIFITRHKGQESNFYSDLLSHLIKGKLKLGDRFVLNIAERGACTRNTNLGNALEMAKKRALKKWPANNIRSTFVFNIQTPRKEPLLVVADYLCWAVQRVFERGDLRSYDFIADKISVIIDIYDRDNYKKGKNYYDRERHLTAKNRICPPLP